MPELVHLHCIVPFSLYTDDSYLIRYREIDMSCCNIVLSLRTDQS